MNEREPAPTQTWRDHLLGWAVCAVIFGGIAALILLSVLADGARQ